MTCTWCFVCFSIIFVNLYRKRDSEKSLWQILQLHWEFKQDRTRYSNTSKNDFLVILHRIFFHTYIYIGISCTFIRAEIKERKKGYKFMPHCRKQETSDLPPSEFLADIAYFKLVRFTHLLFVLSREDKRNNPDGLDKRKNVEKLDGLRQSCHRQWHSRGGFFHERTIDIWRKWLNGWWMDFSLSVAYGDNFYGDISTIFVILYPNEFFHQTSLIFPLLH